MSETSIQAYKNYYPKAKGKRFEIFTYLQENPLVTRKQIAKELNIPIQTVTPRVNELIHKDLVKECNKTEKDGYMLAVTKLVA